jgi:hypothetical protein
VRREWLAAFSLREAGGVLDNNFAAHWITRGRAAKSGSGKKYFSGVICPGRLAIVGGG